jgi:hypothetical protein
MMRPAAALVCASLAFVPLAARAQGDLPFDVRPPGNVVQKVAASLGLAQKASFVAVVSRVSLRSGSRSTTPTYQPYFTLYRAAAGDKLLRRVYQSPSGNDPLKLVPQMQSIPNAPGVWMPGSVDVRVIGSGQLMQPGTSQLVIRVYSAAADCGSATVHVLAFGDQRLHDVVGAQNYCSLEAALQPPGIALTGPYYDRNAALCCPTKNKATALLRYDRRSGKWLIAPQYFRLSAGEAP